MISRFASLLPAAALLLAACAEVNSDAPGPFVGSRGTAAASEITRAASAVTGESQSTGASVNVMATATTFVIAKHQATQRQRQLAVQRARATVAKLSAAPARPGHAQKVPRYLAVETVRDEHTAPQAKQAVMIWDTEAQEMVGNNVYDIANAPAVGATSRFETYSAEYVGAGL